MISSLANLVVWADPGRCGGVPCVRGTRVPATTVTNLLTELTDAQVHHFFPTVEPWQTAVLRLLAPAGGQP